LLGILGRYAEPGSDLVEVGLKISGIVQFFI